MSNKEVIEKRAEQWAKSNLIEGVDLKYQEAIEFGKNMYLDAYDLLDYKVSSLKAMLSAYQDSEKVDKQRIKELEEELQFKYEEDAGESI